MNQKVSRSSKVIVFAREPVPGRTKTRLASRIGAFNAAVLADAFLQDTLAKVSALRLPVVIAADTPHGVESSSYFLGLSKAYRAALIDQPAGNLGTRMSCVLKPYAQNGGILIGSDVPSLPLGHLKRALDLMAYFSVVVGPVLDGGYYLLGVRGSLPPIFHRMRWGRETVLQETLRRLGKAQVRYTLAACWYDVDDAEALAMLDGHLFRRNNPCGVLLNRALPLGPRSPCPSTAEVLARLGIQRPAAW